MKFLYIIRIALIFLPHSIPSRLAEKKSGVRKVSIPEIHIFSFFTPDSKSTHLFATQRSI